MSLINASTSRDNNRVPIIVDGITIASNNQALTGNNTTVAIPIFGLTGIVELRALWGIVTTDLGSNHTASAFRLNDQTAQVDITLATGSVVSSFKAGSAIFKRGLAATAVTIINNSAGRINDPSSASLQMWSPSILTKKTGAITNIEYVYTTTNTPTSGAMIFYARFIPLTSDGNLVAV